MSKLSQAATSRDPILVTGAAGRVGGVGGTVVDMAEGLNMLLAGM